jgi:hypothetical protein
VLQFRFFGIGDREQPGFFQLLSRWRFFLSGIKYGRVPYPFKEQTDERSQRMSLWILLLIIAGWILLQVYILPKFGIST